MPRVGVGGPQPVGASQGQIRDWPFGALLVLALAHQPQGVAMVLHRFAAWHWPARTVPPRDVDVLSSFVALAERRLAFAASLGFAGRLPP